MPRANSSDQPFVTRASFVSRYMAFASSGSSSAVVSRSTSPRTRAGAVNATRNDVKPPCESPTNTASGAPTTSSSATRSLARSQYVNG